MLLALDVVAMISAFAAAALWFQASRRPLRRFSRDDAVDEHDLNRLVVAFNRSQILNSRAALATGVSALAIAARYLAGYAGF
jgi:hypothetical protein